VASRGRHTRSTPQLPLATPEADPEKIVIKGKALREGASTAEPSISDDFHCPPAETPIYASHSPIIQSIGVSRILNFGSVPLLVLVWREKYLSLIFPLKLYRGLDLAPQNIFLPRALPPLLLLRLLLRIREPPTPSSPVAFSLNPLLFPFPP
jgi:hypothetical protein